MTDVLAGKEVDLKLGSVGEFSIDVDSKGGVAVALTAAYQDPSGLGKASSTNAIELNIFQIAEAIAKKNGVTWLETSVKTLEMILGIQAGL